jgi:hypothetical protein
MIQNLAASTARAFKAGKIDQRGISYAFILIMFFIIISGALTLSSAVTLACIALRAPEAYESEHGLQVIRRIPKRDSGSRLEGVLAQAR